ncbi:MAG: helix-hairpin-helix domain-containing protein, partial [Thermomicrobiales bacterium]
EDRLRPEIVIVQGNTDTTISVGITGSVENPGIYPLPAGSRLDDLLEISGGWAGDADIASLNLAMLLEDGDLIEVPILANEPSTTAEAVVDHPAMGLTSNDPRLDLNSATLEELDGLPGIGPVIAQAILDERARLGGFESIEQLVAVSGISERMVEDLRKLIVVQP